MSQHNHLFDGKLSTPVLLLIFNRPDMARRVFARIREVHPAQLFIAADGPRPDRPEEAERCAQARSIVDSVDWPCEVNTLFRDQNLGCRQAVSSAITWFFQHVSAGIILEDDCLPSLSFFPFCAELLHRYRDDDRVMMISGDDFLRGRMGRRGSSYRFSRYAHIWGWATWRRAWGLYDGEMRDWPTLRDTRWLQEIVGTGQALEYWRRAFDATYNGSIDTWAYRWQFSCWQAGGLAIEPNGNLVTNIGIGEDATHTRAADRRFVIPLATVRLPLVHPSSVVADNSADRSLQNARYPSVMQRIKSHGKCLLRLAGTRLKSLLRWGDTGTPTSSQSRERHAM